MKKVIALLALALIPALASAEEVTVTTTETPVTEEVKKEDTQKKLDPKTDLEFTYYWGDGCSHCAKVNAYFGQNDILKKYNIKKKEVYNDRNNQMEFGAVLEALNVERGGVPFMVILDKTKDTGDKARFSYISGDTPMISMFKDFEKGNSNLSNNSDTLEEETDLGNDIIDDKEKSDNNSAMLLLVLGLIILAGFGGLVFYKGK